MTELTVIVICLIAFIAWREWSWAKERATLMQRVQAPERAVAEHSKAEKRPAARVIAVDDDEAMVAAIEARNRGDL